MTGSCLSVDNLRNFNKVSQSKLSDGVLREDFNVQTL